MIESKTLGAVVGIQRQGVIDKSESTVLPATTGALIVGKFRRGRTDKPFTVTVENYQALLGHDPTNPSYTTVEDALKSGASSVMVRRVSELSLDTGDDAAGAGSGGDGDGVCRASVLRFTPKVYPDPDKDFVLLKVRTTLKDYEPDTYIAKVTCHHFSSDGDRANRIENLANYLFPNAGSRYFRGWKSEWTHINNGETVITGLPPNAFGYDPITNPDMVGEIDPAREMAEPATSSIEFLLLDPDEMLPDSIDYVAEQWGENQIVRGCFIYSEYPEG